MGALWSCSMNDGKGCKGKKPTEPTDSGAKCYIVSFCKGCRSTPWLLLSGVIVAGGGGGGGGGGGQCSLTAKRDRVPQAAKGTSY